MISPHQFGFRRRIGTQQALLVVKSALQHHIANKRRQFMVFIDVEAAYDSVDPQKLHDILQLKQFTPSEVNVLMNLLTHMRALTVTEWGDSDLFPLEKGIPQGDSLSPIIFSLYMDIAISILNSTPLSSLPQSWNTIGFVDDIMGLVSTPEEAIAYIQQCSEVFSWLGMKVSLETTKVMQLYAHSLPLTNLRKEEGKFYMPVPLHGSTHWIHHFCSLANSCSTY